MMKRLFLMFAVLIIFTSLFSLDVVSQDQGGDFELTQKLLIVNLRQGETINKNIGLINKLNEQVKITIQTSGDSENVVSSKQTEVTLGPQDHKQIETTFLSGKLGINTGKFIIKSAKTTKELPFISEVWSEKTNIVPKVEIPAEFRDVKAGSDLTFRISVISNSQEESKVDVTYQIIDFNNKVLSEKTEDFLVKDSISVLRKLSTQTLSSTGDYTIGVIVKYENSTSTNTKVFSVQNSDLDVISLISNNLLYILVTIVIVVIVLLYLNYGKLVVMEKKRGVSRVRNIVKKITKIQKITKVQRITRVVKPKEPKELIELSKRRLEKQLASLEAAYRAGYIKKEGYLKGKTRLEALIKPIDKKLKRG